MRAPFRVGLVKRVVMGLDRQRKTPCGFCFVEYRSRAAAERAVRFIKTARLDDRHLRIDWDVGFAEGRQFGRGKSGGQARETHHPLVDDDRGLFADALTFALQAMNQALAGAAGGAADSHPALGGGFEAQQPEDEW